MSNDFDQAQLVNMQRDIQDVKFLMARMVEAMGKIAMIEERQHSMATANTRIADRLEEIMRRQHEQDLVHAQQGDVPGRLKNIEAGFRELHLDNERNKARVQTMMWIAGAAWTFIAGGGLLWVSGVIGVAKP